MLRSSKHILLRSHDHVLHRTQAQDDKSHQSQVSLLLFCLNYCDYSPMPWAAGAAAWLLSKHTSDSWDLALARDGQWADWLYWSQTRDWSILIGYSKEYIKKLGSSLKWAVKTSCSQNDVVNDKPADKQVRDSGKNMLSCLREHKQGRHQGEGWLLFVPQFDPAFTLATCKSSRHSASALPGTRISFKSAVEVGDNR